MVHHDGACRIYGEVGRDGDKDGASVSVETVLNRMGDPILEKGGYFSGIGFLGASPWPLYHIQGKRVTMPTRQEVSREKTRLDSKPPTAMGQT